VKTAPHFGHLIFVSFEIVPQPKENTAKSANAKKMLTHFLITLHLLSSINKDVKILLNTSGIDETDNKNPSRCQVKNKACHLRIKSAPLFMDLKFKSALLILGLSILFNLRDIVQNSKEVLGYVPIAQTIHFRANQRAF
jgi:hypothetical protein